MRIPRACLLLFAGCLLAIVGCKQEEEIRVDTVTHPDRQEIRLRAGAIKRDDIIWFFLIKGPKDEVGKNVDAFNSFVRSAKFIEKKDEKGHKFDEAEWPEPRGWHKDPPGGMRYAAYRIKAEPKELEVTVTRLPAGENWLLTNVHRWQKQVGLPPAASAADLKEPQVVHDKEITWIDLTGLGIHTVSKPPEPMAAAKKLQLPFKGNGPKAPPKAGSGGKLPFKYAVPEGWEKGAAGQMAADRYFIGKEVQVTLTSLGGGDLAGNVNRWREQVGLAKISKRDADQSAVALKIGGVPSYYVDIDNPARNSRILGVIVPLDGAIWVVKMWGPSNRVGENKNGFETFVKSFTR